MTPKCLLTKLARRSSAVLLTKLTRFGKRKSQPLLMMCPHVLMQVLRPLKKVIAACTMICQVDTCRSELGNGVPLSVLDQLQQLPSIRLGEEILIQSLIFSPEAKSLFILQQLLHIEGQRTDRHLAAVTVKVVLQMPPLCESLVTESTLRESIN